MWPWFVRSKCTDLHYLGGDFMQYIAVLVMLLGLSSCCEIGEPKTVEYVSCTSTAFSTDCRVIFTDGSRGTVFTRVLPGDQVRSSTCYGKGIYRLIR